MTTQTPLRTATQKAPCPAPAGYVRAPSTDTADLALRMCRAERRAEALAAAVRLLCEEAGTPEQRRVAALASAVLHDAGL